MLYAYKLYQLQEVVISEKKNGSALSYVTVIIQSSVIIRVTHVDLVYTKCILGVEIDGLTQFLFSGY